MVQNSFSVLSVKCWYEPVFYLSKFTQLKSDKGRVTKKFMDMSSIHVQVYVYPFSRKSMSILSFSRATLSAV